MGPYSNEGEKIRQDEFFYDRLIRCLAESGFGSWRESANERYIDAITFLLLNNDIDAQLRRYKRERDLKRK